MKHAQLLLSITFGIIFSCITTVYGQTVQLATVAEQLSLQRSNGSFEEYPIFSKSKVPDPSDAYRDYLSTFEYLDWSPEAVQQLLTEKADLVKLTIPGDEPIVFEMYRTTIHSSGYRIRTSDGDSFSPSDMAFYHGLIQGRPGSLVAVSVFEGEIRIMYSDKSGAYRIQQSDGPRYIHFKETDKLNIIENACFVDESHFNIGDEEEPVKGQTRMTGNCVEIYFECDKASYVSNGSSVVSTEAWVASIFNEVSIIYENEMIPIVISDILVWTTTDPYVGDITTSQMLSTFVSETNANNYDGRLAHLLSTRGLGGGIAYRDVLCSTSVPCAVSASLSTNVVPFPNYSWNVNVVTHEMGHNFGSRHTHDCAWNGNNTQIDDCGPHAGYGTGNGCYDSNNEILPSSGTVMSYCHLVSGVGINPANGFGPLPGNLIRSRYNNAPCETGTCSAPNCTTLSDPVDGESDVNVSSILYWSTSSGATGYKLTIGTIPGGSNIVNNLDVGGVTSYNPNGLPLNTEIYVTITPYNGLGDSDACAEESFHTETNTQPSCVQLSYPANGAVNVETNVTVTWPEAAGYQTGYLLKVGTTAGGGEILNDLDVGGVNAYDLSGLEFETLIYVRVSPYGPMGTTTGCTTTSFTTQGPVEADDCLSALTISCGTTVDGSTNDALDDDVNSCGTTISAPGVWYKFNGDGSNITLSTCGGTNYDSKLSVYTGSCFQLLCVTGNDDWQACHPASQVTFSTNPGSTYYILVHGWNGNVGDFSLSMACSDPPYCPSQGVTADFQWITNVTLGSLNQNSGKTLYSDFTEFSTDVIPGNSYTFSATPGFVDQSYDHYYRAWIDLNSDGDFDDTNEKIFEMGPSMTSVNGTIVMPSEITEGSHVMRVAMKSNGFPSACEVFVYGEVEDYTVNVDCKVVSNNNNAGAGSLRNAVSCIEPGDTVFISPALQGQVISLTSAGLILNSDVVILANAASQISISGTSITKVFEIMPGKNVTIQGLSIIGGTATLGNGIDNSGNLTLRDVGMYQHSGLSGATLLNNQGSVVLVGNCDIHN